MTRDEVRALVDEVSQLGEKEFAYATRAIERGRTRAERDYADAINDVHGLLQRCEKGIPESYTE